jgi:hypothetical protein
MNERKLKIFISSRKQKKNDSLKLKQWSDLKCDCEMSEEGMKNC